MPRLLVLLLLLICGLGSAFLLPKAPPIRESAVIMNLPLLVGDWTGIPVAPSAEERSILADDTEFEKKEYRGELRLPVHAGIVLSGYDLNNSIHRPERCLPAQGHINLRTAAVTVPLEDGKDLQAGRILSDSPYKDLEEESKTGTSVTYYWFVGCERLTHSHYERTFIDMKDRLFRGFNQRWAYVTIAASLPQIDDPGDHKRAVELADRQIAEFINEVYPDIIGPDRIRGRTGG
ncbi:MAG TPA: exosortase-associated EpsI family protein [Verrucomicrobiales bacterium]|nr:exosortase-associated EpsI family protein [Verrucomicrobiales bacterium]